MSKSIFGGFLCSLFWHLSLAHPLHPQKRTGKSPFLHQDSWVTLAQGNRTHSHLTLSSSFMQASVHTITRGKINIFSASTKTQAIPCTHRRGSLWIQRTTNCWYSGFCLLWHGSGGLKRSLNTPWKHCAGDWEDHKDWCLMDSPILCECVCVCVLSWVVTW